MIDILDRRAFFRFELPIPYLAETPRVDGSMRKWRREHLCPALVELEDREPFADVYWAWNEHYLIVAFDVPNRRGLPRCDPKHWWKQDGVRLCIDTRDTRDNKRGTRFCHFFYFLPRGGGTNGKQPVVGMHRLSRTKERPAEIDLSAIKLGVRCDRSGYAIEAAIPGSCLTGWNPAEHPRIGIFHKIKDVQRGAQNLSVNDELGWNVDPSTWATGVLTR